MLIFRCDFGYNLSVLSTQYTRFFFPIKTCWYIPLYYKKKYTPFCMKYGFGWGFLFFCFGGGF